MQRAGRILLLAGGIAGGLAAVLAWPLLKPAQPPVAEALHGPWIGLPPVVMDAGSALTRTVLRWALESETNLARNCGWWADNALEKYVAHLGDPALQPGARNWRIELEVQEDRIHALVVDASFPPPAPPPPDCKDCIPLQQEAVRMVSAWFTKAELDPIADAWRDPRLWAAPQAEPLCTDGIPAFLEACVAGRYAAFNRNCDPDGMRAAMELWDVVQRLLPAPQ